MPGFTSTSTSTSTTTSTAASSEWADVRAPYVRCVAASLPPLALHTATRVGSDVYLIGGRGNGDEFNNHMHRLRLGKSPFPSSPSAQQGEGEQQQEQQQQGAADQSNTSTTSTTSTTTTAPVSTADGSVSLPVRIERVPVPKPYFSEMAGHASVFHPPTRGIYVYGGFKPFNARYSDKTTEFFVFHVDSLSWSEVRSWVKGRESVCE